MLDTLERQPKVRPAVASLVRANSLARVDYELKCHLRKGNLRKVLLAIVEDYTRGTG